MTNIQKAQKIIQAKNAWSTPPEANEKEVLLLAKAPKEILDQDYKWAVKAISAMTWNAMTLRINR